MRTKLFALLIAGLLGVIPQVSSAIIITGWNVTIDNSLGSVQVNDEVGIFEDGVFNDGQTVVIEIVKVFTSPDFDDFDLGQPLFLRFEKLSENSPSNIVIVNEHITNSSVVDWYDFHMAVTSNLNNNQGEPAVGFDSSHIFTAGVPGNPFQSVTFSQYNGLNEMPTKIDFEDGVVPAGSFFQPGLDSSYVQIVTDLEAGGVFWLKEYPTIPEPATIAFLTLGSLALWRKRKTA